MPAEAERKLAAILSADVVGYSRATVSVRLQHPAPVGASSR